MPVPFLHALYSVSSTHALSARLLLTISSRGLSSDRPAHPAAETGSSIVVDYSEPLHDPRIQLVVSSADPFVAWRAVQWESATEAAEQVFVHIVRDRQRLAAALGFFEQCVKADVLNVHHLGLLLRTGKADVDDLLLLDSFARQCGLDSGPVLPDDRLRIAFGEITRHWGTPTWSPEGPKWRKQVLVAVENGASASSKEMYSEVRFFFGRFWNEDRRKPDGERFLDAARMWVRVNKAYALNLHESFVHQAILNREEIAPSIDALRESQGLVRGALDLVVDHVSLPVDPTWFLELVVPHMGLSAAQSELVGLMLVAKESHLTGSEQQVHNSLALAQCVLKSMDEDGGRFLTLSNVKNMRQVAFLLSTDASETADIELQLEALNRLADLKWDKSITAHNGHFIQMRIQRKLFLLKRYDDVVTRFKMDPARVWKEMLLYKGDLEALVEFAVRHNFAISPSKHFSRLCRTSENAEAKIQGQVLMCQDRRQRRLDMDMYKKLMELRDTEDGSIVKETWWAIVKLMRVRGGLPAANALRTALYDALLSQGGEAVDLNVKRILCEQIYKERDALYCLKLLYAHPDEALSFVGLMRPSQITAGITRRLAFICADHWASRESRSLLILAFFFATHPPISDLLAFHELLLRGATSAADVLRIENLWCWYGVPDSAVLRRASVMALKEYDSDCAELQLEKVRQNHQTYGVALRERLGEKSASSDILLESSVNKVLFSASGPEEVVRKSIRSVCHGRIPIPENVESL